MSTASMHELESGLHELHESELESELEAEFESESEFESEFETETEHELSPIRRVYSDAMMEHLAHEAAEAENEHEAAEHFLPLIPMIAGKLLPMAARALPRVARAIPRIARAVHRVTPQLSRDIGRITRAFYRHPQRQRMVRLVPSIARRTVYQVARSAATGRPLSPGAAVQVLRQQARRVAAAPQVQNQTAQQSTVLDRQYHRAMGIPWRGPRKIRGCGRGTTITVSCGCCGR